MRISKSSLSIISSPTSCLARLSSFYSAITLGSWVHRFEVARPPSRNSSRHADITAAGWPVSRESASRLSPRSSRKTTTCLCFADQRFTYPLLMNTPSLPPYNQMWVQDIRGVTQPEGSREG